MATGSRLAATPAAFSSVSIICDSIGRAGEDDLARAVVVRDDHVRARPLDDVPYGVDRPGDRGHRTGGLRGFRHQHAALSGDTDQVGLGQCAGCVQCGDLAEAVAGDVLGPQPDRVEDAQQSEARRADRRLRPLGCGEQRLVDAVGTLFERRDREHHVVQRMVVPVLISGQIPRDRWPR